MFRRNVIDLSGSRAQRHLRGGWLLCACISVLVIGSACSTYKRARIQAASRLEPDSPVLVQKRLSTTDDDPSIAEYDVKSCREFPLLFLWTDPICVEIRLTSGRPGWTCKRYSHSLRFYGVELSALPILHVRVLLPGVLLSFATEYLHPEPNYHVEFV